MEMKPSNTNKTQCNLRFMGNTYLKETIKILKNAGKCFFGERQYDPAYIPRVLVPVTNVKTEEHLYRQHRSLIMHYKFASLWLF